MLQRNWFFWMEALQITAAERRVVLVLMSVLMVITAIRTFYPGRTIYDESYYEPVIAEFIRLSGVEEEERRLLLARYYPPVEEKPVAALSLGGQLRSEPPNAALFALIQPDGLLHETKAYPGQGNGRPARSTETASDKSASVTAESGKMGGNDAASEEVLKVNIQLAGPEELVRLPGIGPVTAGRIIAYRENNGPFRKPEDLLNVSGIGPVTLERIREFIIVETEADTVPKREPAATPDAKREPAAAPDAKREPDAAPG